MIPMMNVAKHSEQGRWEVGMDGRNRLYYRDKQWEWGKQETHISLREKDHSSLTFPVSLTENQASRQACKGLTLPKHVTNASRRSKKQNTVNSANYRQTSVSPVDKGHCGIENLEVVVLL